ncbi:MAG: hypothetical protein QOI10_3902 [Solirubrobacterales bacterium]|nr:hypothetical protein [Solirubrobacterales bacterium]
MIALGWVTTDMSGVHRNGKIEIVGRVRLQDAEDLARHYTPGVAELAEQAGREPGRARGLTGKGNAIAIVTDGSALLGLGDQGPRTAGRAAGKSRGKAARTTPTVDSSFVRRPAGLPPLCVSIVIRSWARPRYG